MKQLTKLDSENIVSYLTLKEDHLVQQSGELRDDGIYAGKIDEDGNLIINSKGLRKRPLQVDMREANIWVEKKPIDPNREKALTANYLIWSEDARVESSGFRVCIQTEKDLKVQNYVISI